MPIPPPRICTSSMPKFHLFTLVVDLILQQTALHIHFNVWILPKLEYSIRSKAKGSFTIYGIGEGSLFTGWGIAVWLNLTGKY